MNPVFKYFHHLWLPSQDQWHPLLAIYYLTYACDFRCPYCSDGAQTPYYALRSAILPGPKMIELLTQIRRHCDFVVLTGGEPLQYPDCDYVLENLPRLGFQGVVLTTNGYYLKPHLSQIAQAVHYLIFSLDTLDASKADAWFGKERGTLEQILENIELAAGYQGRRYEIIISSVVTPDNIADLYAVYRYAQERGFRFAPCPQLVGVRAHEALQDNRDYRNFYDFLIAEKKRGAHINGTVLYLQYMRGLKKFRCHPFTMLTVSPTGQVFYPCLELGHFAGNLLQESDLHKMRRQGRQLFGPQPECGTQCHSACALGFSLILNRPASLFTEIWGSLRHLSFRELLRRR